MNQKHTSCTACQLSFRVFTDCFVLICLYTGFLPRWVFLCWMSKTVKTSRWSVISLSYSLLIVWFYMSLVNMLSVEVAQWDVSLLALVIFGKRLILYILLMNSSVIVCLFGFNRYWNPHKWKVLCDLILKTLPPSSPWKI